MYSSGYTLIPADNAGEVMIILIFLYKFQTVLIRKMNEAYGEGK